MKIVFATLSAQVGFLFLGLLMLAAQDLPPLPPFDLSESGAVNTNTVLVLQPRPATYRLEWNQSNAPFVHSWRIYASTNFSTNPKDFKFYLQTATTNVYIPIDAKQRFFIVTAVATNGLESGFNAP